MFKNSVIISLRLMARQKLNSFISIAGLAMGITVSVIITSFILNELSYDRFHSNHEKIFRVIVGNIGNEDAWAGTPAPLGPLLKNTFPEVKDFVRLNIINYSVSSSLKKFDEIKVLSADPSFFNIFSFPLKSGKHNELLANPNSIVISANMAKIYFSDMEPLGRSLILDSKEFIVKGVFDEVPKNSHLHFDMVVPFETMNKMNLTNSGTYNYSTYILTHSNIDKQALIEKLRSPFEINGNKVTLEIINLQRLTEIHFEYIRGNYEPVYDIKYIYILASVALLTLLLAFINYINMKTALIPTRAKEFGIKKVSGSGRVHIVLQFFIESFFYVIIAVALAVIVIELSLPLLGNYLDSEIKVNILSAQMLTLLAGITITLVVLSSTFPAFMMSNYKPALILKGVLPGKKKSLFRNVLVVLQFSISIFFIIGTLTFVHQLNYLKDKDLGMHKELIVNVSLPNNDLIKKSVELKNKFLKNPNILQASVNNFKFGEVNWHQTVYWEGQTDDQKDKIAMYIISVDKDFFTTFGIAVNEGRDVIQNFVPDSSNSFVLNESALKVTGWENAAGKYFTAFSNSPKDISLGVVKDFNFRSLHHQIEPCVLVVSNWGNQISVKITGRDIQATLKYLEESFKTFAPDVPFDYYFFDDACYQLYASERTSTKAVLLFTILSILIASLGLLGLVSFMAIQKNKEIGIRKVLGALGFQVVYLLLKEFIILIVLANIITLPIAYYLMHKWLQNFAYKINLSWWIFALSGGIALVIALATVSFQAIKAARANPVDSLKYE
jgi:putative ABC transport system permease protein